MSAAKGKKEVPGASYRVREVILLSRRMEYIVEVPALVGESVVAKSPPSSHLAYQIGA